MNEFTTALRYPWQSAGWLGRLLPLALLQLIPLLGQLVLIGYGMDVTRAVSARRAELPKLSLRRALLDGLQLCGVGLLFCLPVFLTVLLALSTGGAAQAGSSGGVPGFVFPLMMIGYGSVSSLIVRQYPSRKTAVSRLNRLISAVFIIFIFFRLRSLVPLLQELLQGGSFQLSASAMPMLLVAFVLLVVILSALLVVGAEFAITGSSLLNARSTLQKMVQQRTTTLRFLGSVWLLAILTVVMGLLGALFFIVPGLLLLAAGTASIWFLAAGYVGGITAVSPPVKIGHRGH